MNKEKHVCKICGKAFRSEYGLKTHVKTEHAGRYYSFRIGIPATMLIIAIVLIGLTIGFPSGRQTTTITEKTTTQAIDFTLPVYDLSSSTMRYLSLSDFNGKPVFLEFFSPTCGHCINMIPTIEELTNKYGDKVVFLIISAPPREQLAQVVDRYNLKQIVLIDDDLEVFKRFNVEGTPTFITLDSSHNVARKIVGETSMEALAEAIEVATS